MEARNEKLRDGLRKLYYAEIITVVSVLCTILALIPVLGLLFLIGILFALVAALVLDIMGLVQLRDLHDNYTAALFLAILNGILSFFNESTVVDVITTVLGLIMMWLLIKTTNQFLSEIGREDVIRLGRNALLCNVILAVMSIVCLLITTFALGLAAFLAVIALIISLLGLVFYIPYLKQASQAF